MPASRLFIVAGCGLVGGLASAVEDAGCGADVHQQSSADVGVPGHARYVGGVELPGEQGGGAEDVPQAVPGPPAVAGAVAPADGGVGALEDVAVEVGGPGQLEVRAGEDQPERVDPGVLLGAGLLDAGGELIGERVAGGCAPRVDRRESLPVFLGADTYQ